jgi:HK97 family phage portal protein
MRVFGFDIRITKAPVGPVTPPSGWGQMSPSMGGWFNIISESFTGAWQRNVEVRFDNILTFSTVYACVTLISGDIGKLCLNLVEEDEENDIWKEIDAPAFSPVLLKPNHYQTRQKFIEQWVTSKLLHGNTYVLKERDSRNVVTAMYVLDPLLTRVLVAPDGSIYYQLSTNWLAGVQGETGIDMTVAYGINSTDLTKGAVTIPASEIIHDVMIPFYHPLLGVSPLTACGLAATQGLNIQNNSSRFFQNGARPGGILTAPGLISDETAKRLKDHWEQNYTGANSGKIAVLGDGLKYEGLTVNAVDSELINQLKWTSETICSVFHVPPYMVGAHEPPKYNNIEALNAQYYSQALQTLMESIEALLDDGMGLTPLGYGTEFDLQDLLKMDTATQYKTYGDGVKSGIMSPNEARQKLNLPPAEGGENPYLQQQNYSLEALAKRDAKPDPFASAKPPAPQQPSAKPDAKPPEQVGPPPPQKLLPNYSKLSSDEMLELMGSAL